ncbi:MAG: PBP1 and LysM peptidoglycan-binding domain-containing protein [Mesonia hippocampi]|uniref:PBP1 and LysM peptidoglycan-binding domain-containing protein n=1 Tax=Mesonia hippocampi TaxID=1628250 RepID=UPI003F98C201
MKYLLIVVTILFLRIDNSFSQQEYVTHIVKDGERIESIAKKYKTTPKAILNLNPDIEGRRTLTHAVLVIPVNSALSVEENSAETKQEELAQKITFKEHKVKRKETLYGIARNYDIPVDDIRKYNPYLYDNMLGVGDVIRIPQYRKEDKIIDVNQSLKNSTFKNLQHIILPRETKFGIAKKYGMTVEELEKLNPHITALQPGQVVRVTNPYAIEKIDEKVEETGFISYSVAPKDTYYSLTRKYNTTREELEKYNPLLVREGLEYGMVISIPKETPEAAVEVGGENSGVIDMASYLKYSEAQKVAVLLPFNLDDFRGGSKSDQLKRNKVTQISLDFYSGVRMALDSLQKLGISTQVDFYDTKQSKTAVRNLLKSTDFSQYKAIIGPLLKNNISEVVNELSAEGVPVVSPLTDAYIPGGNVFQTRPSQQKLTQKLIQYIDKNKENKNIIIFTDSTKAARKATYKQAFPYAKVVTKTKEEYYQLSDIQKQLSTTQENWVILEADEMAVVTNGVSYLNTLASRNKNYKIRLLTSDKSNPFEDEVSNEYLSNLKFTYTTIAGVAETIPNNFTKTYTEKYEITPTKFAIRGFDITFDVILRLAAKANLYDSLELTGVTRYIENKFDYLQNPSGGFSNQAVYLIEYQEDLTLKEIE